MLVKIGFVNVLVSLREVWNYVLKIKELICDFACIPVNRKWYDGRGDFNAKYKRCYNYLDE